MQAPRSVHVEATRAFGWRRWLPPVLAVALVAYVLSQIDFGAFIEALSPSSLVLLVVFALVWNAALLTADAFATQDVYRRTVCPVRFSELWIIRGASYLPSLLNHHVGQAWITYFLSKVYSASLLRVAGATFVVYTSTFACLIAFSLLSLPFGTARFPWMLPIVLPLVVAGFGFLGLVASKPRFLAQRAFLAPTFALGVRGQLRTVLLRAPHIFVLFLGSWVPLWMFGVEVPFVDALCLVPPVLLVAALPVTPQGIGTRDALSVHLFAAYAQGSAAQGSTEEAAARVAASTLAWVAALVVVQVAFAPFLMKRAYALLRSRPAVEVDAPDVNG